MNNNTKTKENSTEREYDAWMDVLGAEFSVREEMYADKIKRLKEDNDLLELEHRFAWWSSIIGWGILLFIWLT